MSWLWGVFLRIYPRSHREEFGAEMKSVFESAAREQRGWFARARFWAREIGGLLSGAAVEHLRRSGSPETPNPAAKLETQIQTNLRRMEHAIANHQFEKARFYSYYDEKLRAQLRKLEDSGGRAA